MKGPVSTNLKASFLANTKGLTQVQIDWLTRRNGVPPLALAYDGDGYGWPIGAAKVERVGRRFQFRPEDGVGAFVVIARDDLGGPADLVAYEPKAGWTAPWLGAVPLLGLQDLLAQRDDGPLRVHRDMLTWLQDDRAGVVILAPGEARRILEGLTLQADDLAHGEDLRRLLTPPRPRIMVPALSNLEAA
ncbi:hypothetical protein [Lichenibacterium dinghuense]|uniref:hypothetical protein n=1 Tax=Lichenibacterium dinghuense TaxID=2895977 RepID=UPI001F243CED|nr:hypothetical protein [Lichenibacterium sp. 6Y81]